MVKCKSVRGVCCREGGSGNERSVHLVGKESGNGKSLAEDVRGCEVNVQRLSSVCGLCVIAFHTADERLCVLE